VRPTCASDDPWLAPATVIRCEGSGRPPASRFSADMSRHAFYGTNERISRHYREFAKEL
jgi:hypothetical protein